VVLSLFIIIVIILLISYLKGIEIDFLYLFTFGVIYYILLPNLVHEYELFLSFPGMSSWYDIFNAGVNAYLPVIYIFCCVILFMLFLNRILKKIKVKTLSLPIISKTSLSVIFFFIAILCFYFWFNARFMLFKGYSVGYDLDMMGKLATINLICNFFSLYGFQTYKKHLTTKLFFLLLIFNSIILLGMGGRMYVLSSIITFFIYFINNKKFVRVNFIFIAVAVTALMIFIGMFRLGSTDLSLAGYSIVVESVFTSHSSVSFLSQNDIPIFATGELFYKSLIGFLPSFLFENKAGFITSAADLGYNYSSPLGATSIIVSSFVSFGSAGAGLFFIFMSTGFFYLKCLSKRDVFFRTIYLCSLSVIPFMFFRDGFSISLRVLWFVYLIIPLFIITIDVLIKKATYKS